MTGTDQRNRADDGVEGPRLVRLLEEQLELCRTLEALSQRQSEIVAAGDTDELLRVLGERQSAIDAIQRFNDEMEPFRRDWGAIVARLDLPVRTRVRQMVAEVQALIATVAQRDERDGALLSRQRERIAAEMAGVSRGRGAVSAYGASGGAAGGTGGAIFQDRRA